MSILSDVAGAIPVVGGIAQAGVNIGTSLANADMSRQNLDLQKQMADYMQSAQRTTWNREDNAVQRRAADMKAAGINPLLAAGSPAASSAPVNISAPQRAPYQGADLSGLTNGQLIAQQLRLSKIQADEAEYNLGKWKDAKLPSNAGQFAGIGTALNSIISRMGAQGGLEKVVQGGGNFLNTLFTLSKTPLDVIQRLVTSVKGSTPKSDPVGSLIRGLFFSK